eukprot:TRINITY_DN17295_c0_g1_i1.p1 TRINITY_DN17295_c0_g1~~TRINITY_DN17295_c0_g1_i1.p1  ORF type:complete len:799 (+),score=130.82 TRINITY_DN17295_c0_g1_i1:270-2399(+)
MVRTVGWSLGDRQMASPQGEILRIVRELEFDHHRMTSGAVVRDPEGRAHVFIKGSYENVKAIAVATSVPQDYDQVTMQCAKDNYYTLGIAYKELSSAETDTDIQSMSRDLLESQVYISGLLLFRNEIKADSPEAIEQLKSGAIRSVICTGDNELTGIAVGRKCGIVTSQTCLRGNIVDGSVVWNDPDNGDAEVSPESPDPFCQLALTCSAWRYFHSNPKQFEHIWPRCVIFARMKPDDKINVVKYFQGRGLVVGMAGDGGNDCGGLRAAHAGIALSDAEASMVSPFSTGRLGKGAASNDISLTTVPDLIREGRACLATNLATFMYFMVYALLLTTIRTAFLVLDALNLGEWVWLTMDIGIGVIMMFFMTQSQANPDLAHYRPTATLLGTRTISGILIPYVAGLFCLVIGLTFVRAQEWYDEMNPTFDIHVLPRLWMKKGDNYDSPIGVLLLFAVLSTTAYVNTYGGAFRQSIMRNLGINFSYAVFVAMTFWLCLSAPNRLNCIYRVNCDTLSSLACKSIPLLSQFSTGGTGGCFLGPQVKYWQNHTNTYYEPKSPSEQYWLPSSEENCLPPEQTLATIPLYSTTISTGKGFKVVDSCIGPNNCYAPGTKGVLFAILLLYMAIHHGFVKVVLLGPVASALRKQQRQKDTEKLQSAPSILRSAATSSNHDAQVVGCTIEARTPPRVSSGVQQKSLLSDPDGFSYDHEQNAV